MLPLLLCWDMIYCWDRQISSYRVPIQEPWFLLATLLHNLHVLNKHFYLHKVHLTQYFYQHTMAQQKGPFSQLQLFQWVNLINNIYHSRLKQTRTKLNKAQTSHQTSPKPTHRTTAIFKYRKCKLVNRNSLSNSNRIQVVTQCKIRTSQYILRTVILLQCLLLMVMSQRLIRTI